MRERSSRIRDHGCPAAGAAAVEHRGRQASSRVRKRRRRAVLSASLSVILAPAAVCGAHAGDPAAGRDKAAECRTCHGLDGIGQMPNVPNLAGQNESYLQKELQAYRSGERKGPQMSVIAAGLSDEDIENLAAWYASIEITVEVPE